MPERYRRELYTLTGYSGRRLASLMGFTGERAMFDYALATERVNIVESADQWRDQPLVAQRVVDLSPRLKGRRVVLLGNRVARAFGRDGRPHMEWSFDLELDAWVARLPHPSGRSHWWNSRSNVMAAEIFMREARDAWTSS